MTVHGLKLLRIRFGLGTKEFSCGLTFVALSRIPSSQNLYRSSYAITVPSAFNFPEEEKLLKFWREIDAFNVVNIDVH